MDDLWLFLMSMAYGFISSLTAVGAGFLLLPLFMSLANFTSPGASAAASAFNVVTSFAGFVVEKEHRTLAIAPALLCTAYALPGTFIGTALSKIPSFSKWVWMFSCLSCLLLLILGMVHQIHFKKKEEKKWTQGSLMLTKKDWVLLIGIGVLTASVGAPGQLFVSPWLSKKLGMSLSYSLPTAQFTGLFLSGLSVLEHIEMGMFLKTQTLLLLLYTMVAAYYGAKFAHSYSQSFLKILYVSTCIISAWWMLTHSVFPK